MVPGRNDWQLMPAQVTTVDPRRPINIREGNGRGEAPLVHRGRLAGRRARRPARVVHSWSRWQRLTRDTPLPGNDGGINAAGRQVLIARVRRRICRRPRRRRSPLHAQAGRAGAGDDLLFRAKPPRQGMCRLPPLTLGVMTRRTATGNSKAAWAKLTGFEYSSRHDRSTWRSTLGGGIQLAPGRLLAPTVQFNQRRSALGAGDACRRSAAAALLR